MTLVATGRAEPSATALWVLDGARVAIRSGGSTEVIAWNEIVLARWVGNCTDIVTYRGDIKVRRPLWFVIEQLSGLGLLQIHRRIAVSADKVRRFTGSGRHRLAIDLEGERTLEVGRSFQRAVRARFGAPA